MFLIVSKHFAADKGQVLADVRTIIAEQLGTELEKARIHISN